MNKHYIPPNFIWQGRADSAQNERLFQFVEPLDLNNNPIPHNEQILIGFNTDEGVKRNFGRTGAKEGPNTIRKYLSNLACPSISKLFDIGNFEPLAADLESAQLALSETITKLVQNQNRVLLLGGGHEIAWPHYKGLFDAKRTTRIGIINFDAHFDLRQPQANKATSGTPFYQAAEYAKERFAYFVLGIERQANTRTLYETARQLNVHYVEAEDIHQQSLSLTQRKLEAFIDTVDIIYLTLCLDVFDISIAPGVSAPTVAGLTTLQVDLLLQTIFESQKLVSADIAELSPTLDENEKTARLAAWLAYRILTQGFT